MPSFVLAPRETGLAPARAQASLALGIAAATATMLGCGAYQFETLRPDVPGTSSSQWEVPGVPLDYLAAMVKRAQVSILIDCQGGRQQQGNAFVVKRGDRKAFLITAWETLHPRPEQCTIERLHLSGAGLLAMDADVRMGPLDETLSVRGSAAAATALFSVSAQAEGPALRLAEQDADHYGNAPLWAADEVGGPVVLRATGQVVGVVRARGAGLPGGQPYTMAPVSGLQNELHEQADLDLREQLPPYGLTPLPPGLLLPRPEEATIRMALTRSKSSQPPFLLLTGGAGVGQSELANKLAWEFVLSGEFPDGVVRLQVHGRPTDEVLGELHKAVLKRPPQPALAATVSALASVLQGKRLLVVLDDLRMEGDRLPNELSQALAHTAVLGTSRRLYTDPRIQAVEIGTLPKDLARQLLSSALSEAQRGVISDADKDLLCQRLGYNLLGINLAAGAISRSLLTAAAFLERWEEQRLRGLKEATAEASLGVVLEVVWQGLEGPERAVLSGMGLLAEAPVSADMLAALLDEDRGVVAAALERLVAQHVLNRPSQGLEVSMHPLVYGWAKDKAEKTWFLGRKRDRLVHWFLLRARDLPEKSWGLAAAAHLQATQEWAVRDGKLQEVYELAEAWHPRLRESGPWSLWDRMWRNAVENALHSEDRKTLMLSLRQLARTREQAGYGVGAEPLYRESLQIARDLSDQRSVVETLNELGEHEGSPAEAVLLLKTSLEQGRPLLDQALSAHTLLLLSRAYEATPDLDNADRCLQQSLAIYEQISDRPGLLEVLQSLYHLARKKNDLEAAKRYVGRGIEVCRSTGDLKCAVLSYLELAHLAEQSNNAEEAQQQYDWALEVARRAPDASVQGLVLDELAHREEHRGDLASAMSLWGQAKDSVQKSADLKLKVDVAIFGAELAVRLRDYARADEQLDLALHHFARSGDRRSILSTVVRFNYLRWSRQNLSRQLTRLQDASYQAAQTHAEELIPLLDLAMARIYRLRGEPARAQELIAKSAAYFENTRSEQGLALVLSARSALSASVGDRAAARVGFVRAQAFCDKIKDETRLSCLKTVAEDAQEEKQWTAAQKGHDKRLALLRAQGASRARSIELVNAVEDLADLAILRGERGPAQRRYQEALGLWQRLHAEVAVARVLERMARLAWDRGDGLLASQWLQEALTASKVASSKGDTWARIRLMQAQIALRQKQRDQARAYAAEAAELFEKLHAPEAATARALLRKL